MRGRWEGDVDLGDGCLQMLFCEYQTRCAIVKTIGSHAILEKSKDSVEKVRMELEKDLEFLTKGSEEASKVYDKVVEAGRSPENKLMELAWTVAGFQELVKKAMALIVELDGVLNDFDGDGLSNVVKMKLSLLQYLKDLYSKKRVAASYLLVFMIADEQRNKKPYAIPVQFIPYKSLTDSTLRDLEMKVEDAMKNYGMTVVGKHNILLSIG